MATHVIDGRGICDWKSFHDVFQLTFGFPGYYGRNLNAWIDCIDDVEGEAGIRTLLIEHAGHLKATNPEIFDALVECTAFVNWRHVSKGGAPVLALAFHI